MTVTCWHIVRWIERRSLREALMFCASSPYSVMMIGRFLIAENPASCYTRAVWHKIKPAVLLPVFSILRFASEIRAPTVSQQSIIYTLKCFPSLNPYHYPSIVPSRPRRVMEVTSDVKLSLLVPNLRLGARFAHKALEGLGKRMSLPSWMCI